MRKKAFTLIEVVIVMAISLILLTISVSWSKSYKRIKSNLDMESFQYNLLDTMAYAQKYCRKYKKGGRVVINVYENEVYIYFECNQEKLKKISFSSNIKLYMEDTYINRVDIAYINIQSDGFFSSKTLWYKDDYSEKSIAVRVGSNMINEK